MKLKNRTHYRTDDLRRFFLAGIRGNGANPEGRRITVDYTRQRRGSSGCATIGGYWMTVRIPRSESVGSEPYAELPEHLLRSLAHVFEHELEHNLGHDHRGGVKFGGCQTHGDVGEHLGSWWIGMTIRARPSVHAPKPPREVRLASLVAKRAENAQKRLTEVEATLRRYAKLRKKWAAKVRYYQQAALRPPRAPRVPKPRRDPYAPDALRRITVPIGDHAVVAMGLDDRGYAQAIEHDHGSTYVLGK